MTDQSAVDALQPEQTHSAEYNRGWADGNAAALDACNPVIEQLQARVATRTAEETSGNSEFYQGYRAGLNARPAEYRPAVPEALDVERLREAFRRADIAGCDRVLSEYAALRSNEPAE